MGKTGEKCGESAHKAVGLYFILALLRSNKA